MSSTNDTATETAERREPPKPGKAIAAGPTPIAARRRAKAAADGASVTEPAPARRGVVLDYPAGADTRIAVRATVRRRHRLTVASFLLAVLAPTLAAVGYLYARAADQYASTVAFSVRSSESVAPMSFFGALSQTLSIGGADSEIIYEFIRSQPMVEAAAAVLPLHEMYNLPQDDFVFRLGEAQPIEVLTDYWNGMVSVSLSGSSGLITVEARAFDPESAQRIAGFILDESTRVVNRLTEEALRDAVGVAQRAVADAEDRLRAARRQVRAFRDAQRELDPADNARATLSLIAGLRESLAAAQVELDSYLALVGPRGPRRGALEQRIASLELQIEDERARLGDGGVEGAATGAGPALASLVGDYEELIVEQEFAQNAYVAALSAFEQAQIEARRQSRFLSPHINPTMSVQAQYPQRLFLSVAVFILLATAWVVMLLIVYNVRDRR